MPRITPFLWFDDDAEEALKFYASIFKNAKILDVVRYGEGTPMPKGTLMTASFELEGQRIAVMNGGPHYELTPAFSLFVSCKTQPEIDRYWTALLRGGGTPMRCGWLTDRFGVSWQVVPKILPELLGDDDPEKAGRAMQAMLKMVKLDIAKLRVAHAGKTGRSQTIRRAPKTRRPPRAAKRAARTAARN